MAATQLDEPDLADAPDHAAGPAASDASQPPIPSLSARMEERFFAPFKRNVFAARTWQFVIVAVVVTIYGSGLILLMEWDAEHPRQLAKQEETPVEVIVEKPPPPEARKPQPPKPETKQEIEKPATSAPRAPNEEKAETEKQDKETRAPKAPVPPADGKPDHAEEAASPSETPAESAKSEEAAQKPPDPTDKEAEALDRAVPLPPKKPVVREAKLKPPAKLRREEAQRRAAGLSDLPDYTFARPTKKSPVYGGSEDSRYLAIVFGLLMRKYRPRTFVPSDANSITVTFNVDGGGQVDDIEIVQSSGYPEIDAEAAAALRLASPLPPPPAGSPHGLIATIPVVEQHMSTGPRGR